jgi:hypothetical protein
MAALWLDGWTPEALAEQPARAISPDPVPREPRDSNVSDLAGPVSYFALAFFALRWWKLADRRRSRRFSLAPVVATAFWVLILLLVWHQMWRGAVVLMMASAIVQLVSPWEQPPPATSRRLRLRYA